MKELLVHLKPISEFPFLYSDRLFGAICVTIKDLYGEEKLIEMIDKFKESPPFLLSSAFPYIYGNDGDKIYFFPKPIEDLEIFENYKNYIDNHKKLKNVKYISRNIFNDWINGRIDEAYIIKNLNKYDLKSILLYDKENLNFDIRSYDVPRNRLNRKNNSSNVFYFEGNGYKNVNLFFIIRIYDETYEELLRSAINFIKDYRGFGKSLSIGKGQFEIDGYFSYNNLLEIPENYRRFITLSRFIPSLDDIENFKTRNDVFYDIVTKRGMVAGDKPKKKVHFFSEGSTFPKNNKNFYGRILYVHEKSVEYGFAFNMNFH